MAAPLYGAEVGLSADQIGIFPLAALSSRCGAVAHEAANGPRGSETARTRNDRRWVLIWWCNPSRGCDQHEPAV